MPGCFLHAGHTAASARPVPSTSRHAKWFWTRYFPAIPDSSPLCSPKLLLGPGLTSLLTVSPLNKSQSGLGFLGNKREITVCKNVSCNTVYNESRLYTKKALTIEVKGSGICRIEPYHSSESEIKSALPILTWKLSKVNFQVNKKQSMEKTDNHKHLLVCGNDYNLKAKRPYQWFRVCEITC